MKKVDEQCRSERKPVGSGSAGLEALEVTEGVLLECCEQVIHLLDAPGSDFSGFVQAYQLGDLFSAPPGGLIRLAHVPGVLGEIAQDADDPQKVESVCIAEKNGLDASIGVTTVVKADAFQYQLGPIRWISPFCKKGLGDLSGPLRVVNALLSPWGISSPVVQVGGYPNGVSIVPLTFADDRDQMQQPSRVVDAPLAPVFLRQTNDFISIDVHQMPLTRPNG